MNERAALHRTDGGGFCRFVAQRQMATLAEVAKLINSVLDMNQLLDLIMDKAIEVMGAERGFLMLKDQEAGELAMQVARNMEERLTDKAKWQISTNICSRVAGNIGSPSRIEYTVIGDTVNLAARLEPKAQPGGILISDATYQLVKDIVQVEKLSPIEVKGRTGQVEVYALQEITGEIKSAKNLRKDERKDVSLFAVFHEPNVSRAYQGSIKNISSGGLQLSTREPFPAGTELVLSFTTPSGEKLDSVRSKVVRAQPCVDEQGRQFYKLGIAFASREDEGVKKVVAGWRLPT
ncbi:MAG: hypothetical protein FJ249_07675 [Nitrospira sp.]|nr:hypothetical protein [Nitrospira sp.]